MNFNEKHQYNEQFKLLIIYIDNVLRSHGFNNNDAVCVTKNNRFKYISIFLRNLLI